MRCYFSQILLIQISEKLGLEHVSVGIGAKRHIVISKSEKRSEAAEEHQQSSLPPSFVAKKAHKEALQKEKVAVQQQDYTQRNVAEDVGQHGLETRVCDKCSKVVPAANYELHVMRCPGSPTPLTRTKPKKTKRREKKPVDKTTEVEDFNSLIAEAVKQNTTCFYPKCKNNAATLGQNCQFCARRFCLQHYIAEAHGCGDAVRAHARATVSREGVLYRGSGVPDKKPDPTKRAHLERKLNKKLEELTQKRKHNQKNDS